MSAAARCAAFFSSRFMFFFCAFDSLGCPSGSANSPPTGSFCAKTTRHSSES